MDLIDLLYQINKQCQQRKVNKKQSNSIYCSKAHFLVFNELDCFKNFTVIDQVWTGYPTFFFIFGRISYQIIPYPTGFISRYTLYTARYLGGYTLFDLIYNSVSGMTGYPVPGPIVLMNAYLRLTLITVQISTIVLQNILIRLKKDKF